MEEIAFTLNGQTMRLSRKQVITSVAKEDPENIQSHAVNIEGRLFPIKQVFAVATGKDRLDFTTAFARRQLVKLGFEVRRTE